MTPGKKLHELRRQRRKTLEEVSEIIGVSISALYRWEHDISVPKRNHLEKVAAYYGMSLDQMLQTEGATEQEYTVLTEDCIVQTGEEINLDDHLKLLLLRMFQTLSTDNKHRLLGYLERLCVEDAVDK